MSENLNQKRKTPEKQENSKTQKIQNPEGEKEQEPRKLFFNLTPSLPLTFRVSLFLPRSLLSSSHLESFSFLLILAFGPQIGLA